MVEAAGEDERELAAEMAAAFLNENLPEAIFGAPKAGSGQWASLVRLVNPIQGGTLDLVQLEQNEAAFRSVPGSGTVTTNKGRGLSGAAVIVSTLCVVWPCAALPGVVKTGMSLWAWPGT